MHRRSVNPQVLPALTCKMSPQAQAVQQTQRRARGARSLLYESPQLALLS